ncbi:MAG: hypothetical protein HY060_11710, partial [Proteobacteria bacterium]|nr:hypothetical protein [Pseudomonadota bacterium]
MSVIDLDTARTAAPIHAGSRIRHHLIQVPVLLRLVHRLERIERADRNAAARDDAAHLRDRPFILAMSTAVNLLTIGRLAGVLERYLAARGIAAAESPPHRLVGTHFERAGGARLLDEASLAALEARPADGNAHYVRRLCLQQLEGGTGALRAPETLELTNLQLAAAWRQVAEDAAAVGATDIAERGLRVLLDIDIDDNRARRRYAELLRRRDPPAAARHFAAMLDHSPKLPYGLLTAVYRGFFVSFDHDLEAYVAQPVFLGVPRLRSLRPLLRRRNRLLGLLAMRIHLARRLTRSDSDEPPVPTRAQPVTRHTDRRLMRTAVER